MGKAAILIAKAIDYVNAGTVEFIVDRNKNFYFLEVNTRLQVEHPITEAITGFDIVELQIKIAMGASLHSLGLVQDRIPRNGHAIECRLYAEDATTDQFLPSTGTILEWIPAPLPNVRYDSGIDSGSRVSIYYDPILCKIVAHGSDRSHAISLLQKSLRDTLVLGSVTTNQRFLLQVLSHPIFIQGDYLTNFLDLHMPTEFRSQAEKFSEENVLNLCIATFLSDWYVRDKQRPLWKHVRSRFTNMPDRSFDHVTLEHKDGVYKIEYQTVKDGDKSNIGNFIVRVLGSEIPVQLDLIKEFQETPNFIRTTFLFTIDRIKRTARAYIDCADQRFYVFCSGIGAILLKKKSRFKTTTSAVEESGLNGIYKAYMAGKVVKIAVQPGDLVKSGDVLLIMESMKMETKINSSKDGVVGEIYVKEGAVVQEGEPLLMIRD
eukprot:TRINITY_DN2455_c0_g1_i2.p1 TRINITY_DN2455_c0_g1~~TRINITY_DN2455_c0_g1_i2.p1  ORF type:complete len:433 (-),score=89.24 TRINITY_DN2455_c0_g1_i2:19-1317(-)